LRLVANHAQPARRTDAQANHAALLSAAARLFAARGSDVTYEEIAHTAGVGRATLYRHFPSRDDLLGAILDGIQDELEQLAGELPTGSRRFFPLFRACVDRQQNTVPFIDFVRRSTPPATLERMRTRFEELFRVPLRDAQAAGLVRPDIAASDIRLVLLMLSSFAGPPSLQAERDRAVELAEATLRTTP
jgi:AcrR family transcriptional regulator